jgi:hypothetical protein
VTIEAEDRIIAGMGLGPVAVLLYQMNGRCPHSNRK